MQLASLVCRLATGSWKHPNDKGLWTMGSPFSGWFAAQTLRRQRQRLLSVLVTHRSLIIGGNGKTKCHLQEIRALPIANEATHSAHGFSTFPV